MVLFLFFVFNKKKRKERKKKRKKHTTSKNNIFRNSIRILVYANMQRIKTEHLSHS